MRFNGCGLDFQNIPKTCQEKNVMQSCSLEVEEPFQVLDRMILRLQDCKTKKP